ncbi:facilitated trehalose transporter Tret1-2 homolog [Achroia grisella]|uniref:facilitated trehalose transporter Tret1-2 homolog n=1 Tax=Achroia grisella TaxID=688607 RepID=UPI0027D2D915|nr:facilitated trehalose transporter Tret1-2 homolog [Achroia grisella]
MDVVFQVTATFIVSLLNFYLGFIVTWPSYALPILESNTTGPQLLGRALTKQEGSLLSSINMVGSVVAVLSGGFISEMIGRKRSEILSALCFLLAAALIVTAKTPIQILISRLVVGYGGGLHVVVVYVFINEFCQPSIIGNMSSLTIFAFTIGGICSYLCGSLLSYEVISYGMLIFSVILVIFMCFIKESPEAWNSLKFYRNGATEDVEREFACLKTYRETNNKQQCSFLEESKSQSTETNVFNILRTSKAARTALITVTIHIVLPIFMGTLPIQVFAAEFFSKAAPDLSHNLCSIILGVVICMGSGVASFITDLVDRRILMCTSCVVCTVCLYLLSTLLFWSWAPNWVILVIILLFCSMHQVGASNIPFVQIAESFPPEMKSFASTVAMTALCLGNFGVITLYRFIVEIFGLSGTFFLFGTAGSLTTVTSYYIMKETRDVNFEVIHAMYEQGIYDDGIQVEEEEGEGQSVLVHC